METDLSQINHRVDTASRCIEERLAERKIKPEERSEMERYLRYLSLLRRAEYKFVS